jgi:hypothetical protein
MRGDAEQQLQAQDRPAMSVGMTAVTTEHTQHVLVMQQHYGWSATGGD